MFVGRTGAWSDLEDHPATSRVNVRQMAELPAHDRGSRAAADGRRVTFGRDEVFALAVLGVGILLAALGEATEPAAWYVAAVVVVALATVAVVVPSGRAAPPGRLLTAAFVAFAGFC